MRRPRSHAVADPGRCSISKLCGHSASHTPTHAYVNGGGQVRSSLAGQPLLSTQQGNPRPEGRAGTTDQDGSVSPGQCLRRRTRHRGDTADRCWEQPRTPPLRSRLRILVRSEPDTCFLRQDQPTSLEPRWRPPGQCGSLSHRCGSASSGLPDQGIHAPSHRRGNEQDRSHPLPQTPGCSRGLLRSPALCRNNRQRSLTSIGASFSLDC